MAGRPSIPSRCRAGMISVCARAALLATLAMVGLLLPNRESTASVILIAASATADAGLTACSNNRGKDNCVANVLDRLSGDIIRTRSIDTPIRPVAKEADNDAAAFAFKSEAMTVGREVAVGDAVTKDRIHG
jgi:hypothetical protein